MDLTRSYETSIPESVRDRYVLREVRNAAVILQATNPKPFADIVSVLDSFSLLTSHLVIPGGQESALAATLNRAFRALGWREARVDTMVRLALRKMAYKPAGEKEAIIAESESINKGYKVDNFLDRVALDIEWNAKDGNLDRDIAAYRSLYDAGLIDGAVIITRTLELRDFAKGLGLRFGLDEKVAHKILRTTTTTNLDKLQPKIERGDSGGCPLLVICISESTWDAFSIEPEADGQRAMLEAAKNKSLGAVEKSDDEEPTDESDDSSPED